MKKSIKFLIVLNILLVIVFAFPANVSAAPLSDGRTVFGEDYTLDSDSILNGDLTVFGGAVTIENNATVTGDVVVIGGVINVDGTIEGSLTAVGSTVTLQESAVVEGDLNVPASHVTRDSDAVVEGNEITNWPSSLRNFERQWTYIPRVTNQNWRVIPLINRVGRAIGMSLLVMALGALLLLVMPKPVERMTRAMIAKPWEILGFGALTGLAFLVAVVILTVTICLIPIAALLGLAFSLAMLLGWLTLGYELGKQIVSGIFKSHWSVVPTAVLGNFVLYILSRAIGLVPCLGGFLVLVVSLFGLGMVVVTLFGTKPYPRNTEEKLGEPIVLNAENKNIEDGQESQENPSDEENES